MTLQILTCLFKLGSGDFDLEVHVPGDALNRSNSLGVGTQNSFDPLSFLPKLSHATFVGANVLSSLLVEGLDEDLSKAFVQFRSSNVAFIRYTSNSDVSCRAACRFGIRDSGE